MKTHTQCPTGALAVNAWLLLIDFQGVRIEQRVVPMHEPPLARSAVA